MSILYKYFSSNLQLNEYLLNPTIRLSQTNSLNDPFEGILNNEIIKLITEKFISSGQLTSNGNDDDDNDEMREVINKIIRGISVVSLTETQRNLLMWSHYASEHMGVCIGYQNNMLNKIKGHVFSSCYSTTPVKVNYDSIVFDDEQKERVKNAQKMDDDILNDIVRRAFITKGDSWIYEKEHRMILPLEFGNVIVLDPTADMPEDARTAVEIMTNSKWYRIKQHEDSDLISIFPSYKEDRPMIDKFTTCENNLSLYKDALFLRTINKSDVRSIYLGCKYPEDEEEALIKLIKSNNSGLEHIHIYRMSLSNDRFDLVSNTIYESRSELR